MSAVVSYTIENQIAIVQMADRSSRNTFSHALTEGLTQVFFEIENNLDIKVVIVSGYENYFCCGGTQEELLKFQQGTMNFSGLSFYRLLLDCSIPTIAAMQGHAVGGGLAFGCYADFIIMAEECIYSANFMKYGFTPGMGATYIIPKKMGTMIGNELLYTADTYLGAVLKQRGLHIPVVKKMAVLDHAMQIAKQLADKPQKALRFLKESLTQDIQKELPAVIKKELIMHEITFADDDVKTRIEERFGR